MMPADFNNVIRDLYENDRSGFEAVRTFYQALKSGKSREEAECEALRKLDEGSKQ